MSCNRSGAPAVGGVGIDVDGLDVPGLDGLARGPDGSVDAVGLMSHLRRLDADGLATDYEVLELVTAWDRVGSWVSAQQLTAMAEFARRPDVMGADAELAKASRAPVGGVIRARPDDEIAAQLAVSRMAASTRLGLAVKLADQFGLTGQALAAGRIDVSKARVIVDECGRAAPQHLHALQRRLLPRAGRLTAPRLREHAQRAVMALDPAATEKRSKAARAAARVILTPGADGVAELWAQLPAQHAAAIEQVIDAVAHRLKDAAPPSDTRTIDQWRAAALAMPFIQAMVTGTLDGETPVPVGTRGRSPVRINVTVPASVLLGLSEAPAQLDGHGPIPASLARLLAQDATWRRILTDPQGRVTEVGTTRYRPSTPLTATVQLRHQRCVHPACGARAERCDLDHIIRHPHGPTTVTNLAPECEPHHHAKHRDDLHDGNALQLMLAQSRSQPPPPVLQPNTDGTLTWTMPTGHRHLVAPPALVEPDTDATLIHATQQLTTTTHPTQSRAEQALTQLLAA